jgi:hypothetical protein
MRTVTFQLPQGFDTTDALQVVVHTNYGNGLFESDINNDAAAADVTLPEPYQATVNTAVDVVPLGVPITITGHASFIGAGGDANGRPLTVRVLLAGSAQPVQAIAVTTDAQGDFTTTFTPNQPGVYGLAVAPPLSLDNTVQSQFNAVYISSNSAGGQDVVPGTPVHGTITVNNLGQIQLTGLSASVTGAPGNLDVQISVPDTVLPAVGTAAINYTLTASNASVTYAWLTFNITTDVGATTTATLPVSITPLAPRLSTDPAGLNSGMLVGQQTLVTFQVTNTGNQPTGDLRVRLPDTEYLSLVGPNPSNPVIPSLAPGESATITLQLLPPANLPLGLYTGVIEVSNNDVGILEPFTFRATTIATGDVRISATDYITPQVPGTHVELLDPYDNSVVVAEGITDASGFIDLGDVIQGTYLLSASATHHSSTQMTVTVTPGIINQVTVYLAQQLVPFPVT